MIERTKAGGWKLKLAPEDGEPEQYRILRLAMLGVRIVEALKLDPQTVSLESLEQLATDAKINFQPKTPKTIGFTVPKLPEDP